MGHIYQDIYVLSVLIAKTNLLVQCTLYHFTTFQLKHIGSVFINSFSLYDNVLAHDLSLVLVCG